jgi:hypothetical protein
MTRRLVHTLAAGLALLMVAPTAPAAPAAEPLFSRHVEAVFSRLGCNGGTCHGAVKGRGGFRLSLFAAEPALDHDRLLRESAGRRLDLFAPDRSLLLLKATGRTPHQGGQRTTAGSPEYETLRRWIAGGAKKDDAAGSRVTRLSVTPPRRAVRPGERYRLSVRATFADGSAEDVTHLCVYESLDPAVAGVDAGGQVTARGPGDAGVRVRFAGEPALATLLAARPGGGPFPAVAPNNFIDAHVLAKLRLLNISPAGLADDATFLRRATLDATGELPTPAEVRAFLADGSPGKRERAVERLLARPGHSALWTLKFCDLLKAGDFGVYADGMRQEVDAPRFQAWVRARLQENTTYDRFVERIVTATSRDGRPLEEWAQEVVRLEEGYAPGRPDLAGYRRRKTLDLYWQRKSSAGVDGALQVAHAFLGLRLECARCHRHPHDTWQQDDLLSFANFFMGVRKTGFHGENEKRYAAEGAVFKRLEAEAKQLSEQVKKMRDGEFKKLSEAARKARDELNRLRGELQKIAQKPDAAKRAELEKARAAHQATVAAFGQAQAKLRTMEGRARLLPEAARRILHAEVRLVRPAPAAEVSSPLGTQSSKRFRLLGGANDITPGPDEDPRRLVMAWMRRPDNPYFARAIVNRVWAHYFGRGIIDPPDNLSSFNPPSHPELLRELSAGFVRSGYDLRWLHRTILTSRTYQQDSLAGEANHFDRANYAYFHPRRLPAEVLLDALNRATGTTEKMGMEYHHWPKDIKTVEIPYTPRNDFVAFALTTFGKPKRNAAVQCDCERDGHASVLQVLGLMNHPRVWAKIRDPSGLAARVAKELPPGKGVEELFLAALGRFPTAAERDACLAYVAKSETPLKGVQGVLWGLLNTREFILQH